MISKWGYSLEMFNSGKDWQSIFVPCDLEIWRMALKNYRALLLCHFKLYASFHSHQAIQARVTARKRPIQFKIRNLWSSVALKFDWRITLKINTAYLLCYLCIISQPSMNSNPSYSPETSNWDQNRQSFVPCDPEIRRMISKNNRAPLLCYFKLCALFRGHL